MTAPSPPAACRTCGRSLPDDVLVCPHDGTQLPLERRLLDGKFRLEKRLGQGGMATVWQATNEFIERPVAIKLMHARYAEDADLLARFRNEATAAGRIGSPHICDVLDFGRSVIGPYIVMELLGGASLSDLIHAYRRLNPGLAVWILRQALAGLDAAHRAGIVHRDLKPENIYLCRSIREQWLVKLMDFGISKFTDSIRTGAGTMMGSPNYMAPEQIHGAGSVDARADLWSVGVILYESISGQNPFARDTIADSLAAVRGLDPPPLHTFVPSVPPGLSEIVARCLAKQPDQRWPSAQALALALRPFERATSQPNPAPDPRGDVPRPHNTLPKSGAVPRALVDFIGDKPASGPYPPVPQARPRGADTPPSGAYPPVPQARHRTGAQAPAAPGRGSGVHPPVSPARPRADRTPDAPTPVSPARPRADRTPDAPTPVSSVRPRADRAPEGSFPAVRARGPADRTPDAPTPVVAPAPAAPPSARATSGFKPVPRGLTPAKGAAPTPRRDAPLPAPRPRAPEHPAADDPITRPLRAASAASASPGLWIFLGLVALGAVLATLVYVAL